MTSYTWSLPSSTAGASGTAASDAVDQLARFFGRDIWFDVTVARPDYIVTPAGDWRLVEGREALRQSLLRRTITNPGEWATLPDFGVGARLYVKERNTPAKRDELAARIRSQYLRDPRVERVEQVVIEAMEGEPGLHILVEVIPRGRLRGEDALTVQIEVT